MVNFLNLLGGIALFIFGLSLIGGAVKSLTQGKNGAVVARLCSRPIGGVLAGAVTSAIAQSSVAVNFVAVELVEAKVLSFYCSAAVIMGANIGTTATAQIVSSVGVGGEIIGAIVAIIGLLLGFFKNAALKNSSQVAFGLATLFAGFAQMQKGAKFLSSLGWFSNLLLNGSPFALFLIGLLFTAICQSSSALTGLTVALANCNLISFCSAAYLTLGSNVGSCFAVVLLSLGKKIQSRQTALFNLVFNLFGALVFFPIIYFYGGWLQSILSVGKTAGKTIADFHTLFNLICTLICLPVLKPLTNLVRVLSGEKLQKGKSNTNQPLFTCKKSRNF